MSFDACLMSVFLRSLCLQSYHWNEKRFIAQYYADLSRKEARDQAERQAQIQAKFQALEEELLG